MLSRSCFGDQDQIHACGERAKGPDHLAQAAFSAVTHNSITDLAAGGQAEAKGRGWFFD